MKYEMRCKGGDGWTEGNNKRGEDREASVRPSAVSAAARTRERAVEENDKARASERRQMWTMGRSPSPPPAETDGIRVSSNSHAATAQTKEKGP